MDKKIQLLSTKSTTYLLLALLLTTLAGILASRTLGFIPSLVGLIFFIALFLQQRFIISYNKYVLAFIGICAALMLSSISWAPNSAHAIEKCAKIFAISLFGYGLIQTAKLSSALPSGLMLKALLGTFLTASAYLLFEEYFNFPLNDYFVDYQVRGYQLNRSAVIFSVFSIMALLFVKNQQTNDKKTMLIQLIICALTLCALCLSKSQTAQVTFLCGLFFIYIFPIKSLFFGKLLFGAIIIINFTLPFILLPLQNLIPQELLLDGILREASIIHRFEVWEFTITEIKRNLFWGHGIDAQRFLVSDKWMKYQDYNQILHAHNIVLQIWIEFGLIGATLGSMITAYFYKTIYSEENLQARSYMLVAFTALYCCLTTGYGIWQSWQIGLVIAIAALAIFFARQHKLKA